MSAAVVADRRAVVFGQLVEAGEICRAGGSHFVPATALLRFVR